MTYGDEIKEALKTYFKKSVNSCEYKSINEICEEICEILPEKSYIDGLNDAWECARKIMLNDKDGGIPYDKLKEIFYDTSPYSIFKKYKISEAIAMIKAYEGQENEIKQWDEICGKSNPQNKLIVVGIGAWGDWHCVDNEGHTFKLDDEYKKYWEKTGKSYPELANILELLKGDKK